MSELDHRPPPPVGVPGLGAPPPGWGGGPSPVRPGHGDAGDGSVIAVPIAPPGGSGRPIVLIISVVIVIVLVWTAPVYFYWWKPRHGLGTIAMSQIRAGDCIDFADRDDPNRDPSRNRATQVRRVKCSGAHYFEVTEVLDLGIRNTLVPETCAAAFERYVGIAPKESTAWDSEAHPDLAADGTILEDRTFCVIYGIDGPATSSARGTRR